MIEGNGNIFFLSSVNCYLVVENILSYWAIHTGIVFLIRRGSRVSRSFSCLNFTTLYSVLAILQQTTQHVVQRASNSTTNNSARCTACWQFYNTHLSTLYSVLAILQQTTQHIVQRADNSAGQKKPFTYNVHQNSEYTQRYVVYGGHCTYTDYYLVPQTKT